MIIIRVRCIRRGEYADSPKNESSPFLRSLRRGVNLACFKERKRRSFLGTFVMGGNKPKREGESPPGTGGVV